MWKPFLAVFLLYSTATWAQMVPAQLETIQAVDTGNSQSVIEDATFEDAAQFEKNSIPVAQSGELIVSLQTDRTKAYVNEQILLTLRVAAPEIAFNVTGDELLLNNVDMVPLKRQQSITEIDGKSYQQNETVFAVFPRDSGVLNVPALSFQAVLPVSAKGSKGGEGNPTITASTRELQLSIEPAPVAASTWFPAQNVDIDSNWSLKKTGFIEVRAGEPVTREVTIKVSGQHPGAVPAFEPATQVNVRTYPDQPRLQTEKAITGLNGTYTRLYTIIAAQPGTTTLPPIDINWWHIDAGEWRTATLPAEQLNVVAAALGEVSTGLFQLKYYHYALGFMMAGLLFLSTVSLILWRRNRQLIDQLPSNEPQKQWTEAGAWSILQKRIRQKKFVDLRQALIQWARVRWPEYEIRRLEQIPWQNQKLHNELKLLDHFLYSENPSPTPDLTSINKALRLIRKKKFTGKKTLEILPELYPETNWHIRR